MSNLIPPLLSSSPPPIVDPVDEDEEDEFGDFRAATNSYDCDDFSLPTSPQASPQKEVEKPNLDLNSNNNDKLRLQNASPINQIDDELVNSEIADIDFQLDKRKFNGDDEIQVNFSNSFDINSDVQSQNSYNEANSLDTPSNELENEIIADEDGEKICDSKSETEQIDSCVGEAALKLENCDKTNVDFVENPKDTDSPNSSFRNNDEDTPSYENDDNEISFDDDDADDDFKDQFDQTSQSLPTDEEESPQNQNVEPELDSSQIGSTEEVEDDDFGDFMTKTPVEQSLEDHSIVKTPSDKSEDDNFDDFDDFVTPEPTGQSEGEPSQIVEQVDDFGDFESSELPKSGEEEFGDFGDFSNSNEPNYEKPVLLDLDPKNVLAKSEAIVKEIFPSSLDEVGDFRCIDETSSDNIFNHLKDVTETDALQYQWAKSTTQKFWLKSLNIDLRNILYGPSWNSSMPRFAANLGVAPLEPIKSEILSPTPLQPTPSPSSSSQNSEIPTAQFDWTGSGLVNPLDYSQTMLLDLEQLVVSLDMPTTTTTNSIPSQSPNLNELLDDWDLWLQTTSTPEPSGDAPKNLSLQDKSESEFSANLEKLSTDMIVDKEFMESPPLNELKTEVINEFLPFESPKLIPLRETYIVNDNPILEQPSWYQDTILTPELPRKEPQDLNDEDFDDFQMVLPEETAKITPESPVEMEKPSFIAANIPEPSQERMETPSTCQQTNDEEDDEFTDFHSSLPVPTNTINNVTPIMNPVPVPLEPLKPTIQYSTPNLQLPTQINWPDPGVTEEDIRNIELSFSLNKLPEEKPTDKIVNKPPPINNTSKINSMDDEEWSDFISVPTTKSALNERTSTPDLPLSVLNLGHIQPTKPPIPVITPSGLVQTKLLSDSPQFYKPPQPQQQFPNNFVNKDPLVPIQTVPTIANTNQHLDDDDDWSDFVFSKPMPQTSNGLPNNFQKNLGSTSNNNSIGRTNDWTSANIITNPGHFDTLQNYMSQPKKVQPKNTIPSISAMPELDFIAPKNRTSKK